MLLVIFLAFCRDAKGFLSNRGLNHVFGFFHYHEACVLCTLKMCYPYTKDFIIYIDQVWQRGHFSFKQKEKKRKKKTQEGREKKEEG